MFALGRPLATSMASLQWRRLDLAAELRAGIIMVTAAMSYTGLLAVPSPMTDAAKTWLPPRREPSSIPHSSRRMVA